MISLSLFLRCLWLIFLLILILYILYLQSIHKYSNESKIDYQAAGIKDTKLAKVFGYITSLATGTATAYSTYVTYKNEQKGPKLEEELKSLSHEIQKGQEEISQMINLSQIVKTHAKNKSLELNSFVLDALKKHQEAELAMKEALNLQNQLTNLAENSQERSSLLAKIDSCKLQAQLAQAEAKRSLELTSRKSVEFINEMDNLDIKDSFIGFDLIEWINKQDWIHMQSSFWNWFTSLSIIQKNNITALIFHSTLSLSILSILLYYFGEYLINKFQLETRSPRLAIIIKWRRKIRQVYINFLFVVMFYSMIGQFIFLISMYFV